MTSAAPARKLALAGMGIVLITITAAMAVIAWFAFGLTDRVLTYETMRKAESVARSLAGTFDRAAELGIPLEKMPGVSEKLTETRQQHAELSRITVVVAGKPLYTTRADDSEVLEEVLVERVPIASAAGTSELLEVAVDPRFVTRLFSELLLDFLVILVVAGFVTLELIYFLAGPIVVSPLNTLVTSLSNIANGRVASAIPANFAGGLKALAYATRETQSQVLAQYVDCRKLLRTALRERRARGSTSPDSSQPIRAAVVGLSTLRDRYQLHVAASREEVLDPKAALGSMRAPFFLLLLAEDLSRGFLPLFAGTMSVGPVAIPAHWVVGLPIFLFMLIVALSQPVLGGWSDRLGRRKAFLVGAAIGAVAHLLAAQADTLFGLLLWRAGAGVAWAIAFVAAQGIVLDYTNGETRTKGLATFVSVIMVSMICGPSVGGLLADGLGYRATFVVASALAALAALIAWRSLPKSAHSRRPVVIAEVPVATKSMHLNPLANPRFAGLLLLAAVPAKLLLVAYCFYLIPLFLSSTGSSAAMAGRIIMIYSVMMVLFVPVVATQIDRLRTRHGAVPHAAFVAAGLILSGIAGLAMALPYDLAAAVLVVSLLGIAQAISISPQAAMVPDLTRVEIARFGESTVYGYYRLVERIGNALGPLAAAALLPFLGFKNTFIVLGLVVFTCGIVFAWLYIPRRSAPEVVATSAAAE